MAQTNPTPAEPAEPASDRPSSQDQTQQVTNIGYYTNSHSTTEYAVIFPLPELGDIYLPLWSEGL